jgi:hypothetical protein
MPHRGLSLRHLVFTGPCLAPATLSFVDGLNIVFGASDTGKSFIVKAISYMIGAVSKLPKIEERDGYDAAWLGLVLPTGREVTLYRSTKGGGLKLHEGLVRSAKDDAGIPLAVGENKKGETVSHYLLNAIGLADKLIIKNASAEKDKRLIRLLAPLVLVEEDAIISGRSPILYSGQHTSATFEKNLFRLLLTGQDDKVVQTVMTPKARKVVTTAGRIDLGLGRAPGTDQRTARFQHRMPTRAAAVRELLKLGLAANATAGNGMKSSNYGVFSRGPTGHLGGDATGE